MIRAYGSQGMRLKKVSTIFNHYLKHAFYIMENIKLNNGLEIPVIGLGTFQANRLELVKAVYHALCLGYISFDTSSAYNNEKWLGRSLKLMRMLGLGKETFITTKLSNADQRKGDVCLALKNSLERLNVKSIDMYLMHWPNPGTYLNCWKQMEELYNEGLVKAIGVCNFHQHHLEQLLKIASVIPAVNQIELHPLLSQVELHNYCENLGIKIIAYSPLARMHPKLVENKTLLEIAAKYNKTVPQIILKWNLQHDIIVIPKSSSFKRLKENISLFDFVLTYNDMNCIDELNESFRVCHNPDTANFSQL